MEGLEAYRELDFGEAGHLDLEVDCRYQNGKFLTNFVLNGSLATEELGLPGEITEIWTRTSNNTIQAAFDITWARGQTGGLTAETQSRYVIDGSPSIPEKLRRTIKVTPKVLENGIFTLFQETWLN